jgi:hypothetical protein
MSAQQQTITIEVTVPDPAWTVTIEEVYATQGRLLVISTLDRDPEVMASQVISRASDTVGVTAPDWPVEHYVLGKTFGWAADPHTFIQDRQELEEKLKNADLLYRRKE